MNILSLKVGLFAGLLTVNMTIQADEDVCNIALGEKIYAKCAACHTNDESGKHMVGPNLHGLLGRMSGSYEDYAYSVAMQEAPQLWTPEALDKFLESPMGVVPGTSMAFAGIRKPHQRAAVICYLNGGVTP
jgi:cytochrome c